MPDSPNNPAPAPKAIVVGFGPVGRLVTEQLEADGFKVTLIERNNQSVLAQLALSRSVVAGDAEEEAVLINAGIRVAKAIVITTPCEQASLEICLRARSLNETIFISARANHVSHGMLCQQAGADHVTVEEIITAQAMRSAIHDRVSLTHKLQGKRHAG